jgi:hypothetical protein
MSISETFLASIEESIKDLDGPSAKAIAEDTEWDIVDVKESLLELIKQSRIERRGKARGTKYYVFGAAPDPNAAPPPPATKKKNDKRDAPQSDDDNLNLKRLNKREKDEDRFVDRERTFDSVEDFMRTALLQLPANIEYTNQELADTLCNFYPNSGFNSYNAIMKIGWSVKLNFLYARHTFQDGNRFLYSRSVTYIKDFGE